MDFLRKLGRNTRTKCRNEVINFHCLSDELWKNFPKQQVNVNFSAKENGFVSLAKNTKVDPKVLIGYFYSPDFFILFESEVSFRRRDDLISLFCSRGSNLNLHEVRIRLFRCSDDVSKLFSNRDVKFLGKLIWI